MRRDREKAEKRKKTLGLVLTLVMFGSVFTFIFFGFRGGGSASNSIEYNNFEFINRGAYWTTTIDGREALFTYLPDDLGFIFVNDPVVNALRGRVQIDTTYQFNDTFAEQVALAQFQMGTTLFNFNIFVRNGFTSEHRNFPVITCDDATQFVPVIYFKSSNETGVYLEDDCVIAVAANQADVIRIKDRIVYGILGII